MAVTLKGNNGTYEGTSEDNKPLDVPVNTEFNELDTGKTYYFDGETWNEEPTCEGSGFTPTAEQLAAMNSGITAEDVAQISTNENNISMFHKATNTEIYFSETEPTGTITDGSYWISTTATKIYDTTDIYTGTIEQGSWQNSTLGKADSTTRCRSSIAVPVSTGDYVVSLTNAVSTTLIQVAYRDIGGATISNSGWVAQPFLMTLPENCTQITVIIKKGTGNIECTPTDFGTMSIYNGSWS